MKNPILMLAVLALGLTLSGCGTNPGSIPDFVVDGVTATVTADQLQLRMTHHGHMHMGEAGWSFQVFIDADNDPATGYKGAEFMVNGVEVPTADGFVIRKVVPQGLSWGPELGHSGSDDGTTLKIDIPLALIPPTAAPAGVTFATFVNLKGNYSSKVTAN